MTEATGTTGSTGAGAPEPCRCQPDELRELFLFEKLSDAQLGQLCEYGRVEMIPPGKVFTEGDPATCFYVLMDGELVLSRQVGGDEVDINTTSHKGVYAGAWQSYLGERAPQAYTASLRVTVPSKFFVLPADDFAAFMKDWFPMALHMLEGLFFGMQRTNSEVGQRERLLALGSLSAGLTHELNNPAAAAVRATASLRERIAGMRHKLGMLASGKIDGAKLQNLVALQEEAVERVAKAPKLGPLEASDAEDELADWLDEHGIAGGYDLAPVLVPAIDAPWLAEVETRFGADKLESAVRWLTYSIETEQLMTEIEDATVRISTLVAAAKQYSNMDRAPFQVVDVHELLDSTLVMLARKIDAGVTVVKEYDRALPAVPVYAAELNQVWTNLIDNALQAMAGTGKLTLRTGLDGDRLLVEVCDTGPGVPAAIQERIFEPFFTTKPVGEGTGLGLDISWRIVVNKHHGDLRVESVPGDTRFQVRLPLAPDTEYVAATEAD
jgi:signal transduction histidine kinase